MNPDAIRMRIIPPLPTMTDETTLLPYVLWITAFGISALLLLFVSKYLKSVNQLESTEL